MGCAILGVAVRVSPGKTNIEVGGLFALTLHTGESGFHTLLKAWPEEGQLSPIGRNSYCLVMNEDTVFPCLLEVKTLEIFLDLQLVASPCRTQDLSAIHHASGTRRASNPRVLSLLPF